MENIIYPLLGGLIIGLAATMLLGFNGRVAGISGILAGTLSKVSKEHSWRYAFVLGLIFGGVSLRFLMPEFFNYTIDSSYIQMIIAGLLVGVGTRIGSGCTSGHGVCGLPRFSMRSLVATITFMAVAIITVFIKELL